MSADRCTNAMKLTTPRRQGAMAKYWNVSNILMLSRAAIDQLLDDTTIPKNVILRPYAHN